MHVTFFASDKDRENTIALGFKAGVEAHGDSCHIVRPAEFRAPVDETDVAVIIGVKGYSRQLFDDHLAVKKHVIYIDKAYLGKGKSWRMSVDSFQPLAYFQKIPRSDDRLRAYGIQEIAPMRKTGEHVIIAGGSLKYAMWHHMNGLEDNDPMTTWALKTRGRLRKYTRRSLIYRPKPTWPNAIPIAGCHYSRPPEALTEILKNCWALVTYGSNAAVEALICGVPVIITGDGIAQPLAKQAISSIEDLYIPTDEERWQWLANIAYCQFNMQDLQQGVAWKILREQLNHVN